MQFLLFCISVIRTNHPPFGYKIHFPPTAQGEPLSAAHVFLRLVLLIHAVETFNYWSDFQWESWTQVTVRDKIANSVQTLNVEHKENIFSERQPKMFGTLCSQNVRGCRICQRCESIDSHGHMVSINLGWMEGKGTTYFLHLLFFKILECIIRWYSIHYLSTALSWVLPFLREKCEKFRYF